MCLFPLPASSDELDEDDIIFINISNAIRIWILFMITDGHYLKKTILVITYIHCKTA